MAPDYIEQECSGLSVRFVLLCYYAEDVDPSVGRFRNMIQTSFIPSSKVSSELLKRCMLNEVSLYSTTQTQCHLAGVRAIKKLAN